MLIHRHITVNQRRTTLALEPLFWETIKHLAGEGGINAWMARQLETKPPTEGRASWVRQRVLGELVKQVHLPNDFGQ